MATSVSLGPHYKILYGVPSAPFHSTLENTSIAMARENLESLQYTLWLGSIIVEMGYIQVVSNEMLKLGAIPRKYWIYKTLLAGLLFRVALVTVTEVAELILGGTSPFECSKTMKKAAIECVVIVFEHVTRKLWRLSVYDPHD